DCVDVKINHYDYLFNEGDCDFIERINPNSKQVYIAKAERFLVESKSFDRYQFMRQGYFMAKEGFKKSNPEFNEIVGLKDNFNK
ncbi:MAG: glutamine--tRNA ligase, partial [Clostridia bacterium]